MKPILFNTAMVQAILEGKKTTTRRAIKVDKNLDFIGYSSEDGGEFNRAAFGKGSFEKLLDAKIEERIKAPYMPGDILYIRETWKQYEKRIGQGEHCRLAKFYGYKADEDNSNNPSEFYEGNWKPSIHMPKDVARIFLKVTGVRAERLQDIDYEAVKQEGIKAGYDGWLKEWYDLWNSTLKKNQLDQYGFNANPWVWVIEFERIDKSEVEYGI
ncbi:hypothetical protein FDB42_12045 [Clostridium botulinum]|nr:hypothetical protein [Clostridium botulinum]